MTPGTLRLHRNELELNHVRYFFEDHYYAIPSGLYTFYMVDSISLEVGDNMVGDAGNLAESSEAEVVTFDETPTTPGFDFRMNFVDVISFNAVAVKWANNGSANHYILTQIYDHVLETWVTITSTVGSGGFYKSQYFAVADSTSYVNEGEANLRLYHPESGNRSHDATVDYCTLIQFNA